MKHTLKFFSSILFPLFLAGSEWLPVPEQQLIPAGSALDFSFLLNAPAGKYGVLKTVGNHFEFEKQPGKPVRFYGVNLGGLFLQDNAGLDKIADELARCGYNLVRLHHFDQLLVERSPNSTELDPERLDRLDYLVAALKKRGIYLTLDLYTIRATRPGELPAYPDRSFRHDEYKGLIYIDDAAMKNWMQFSRNLLEHRNPYTGLSWKKEPAIVFLSLVNEDTLFDLLRKVPFVQKIYEEEFMRYAARKKIQLNDRNRAAEYDRFLTARYLRGYRKMRDFCRRLGVVAPICGQNYCNYNPQAIVRREFDYVDNHFYHGHPSTGGRTPLQFNPASAIPGKLSSLTDAALSRDFRKPFVISEYDFCTPNPCNVEGALLTGAYGAFQGWDAICRFAYEGKPERCRQEVPLAVFTIRHDPLRLLSERAAQLFFLRGDVKRSNDARLILQAETAASYPRLQPLALLNAVGTMAVSCPGFSMPSPMGGVILKEIPRHFISANLSALEAEAAARELAGRKKFLSDTRELSLDAGNGTFSVITPFSEGAVLPGCGVAEGRFARIENLRGFAAFAVASLDNRPLASSRRILLLHLTSSRNSNMIFRGRQEEHLQSWGTLPILVRNGAAKLTLNRNLSKFRCYALDLNGVRVGDIPLTVHKEHTMLSLYTGRFGKVIAACELVSEDLHSQGKHFSREGGTK